MAETTGKLLKAYIETLGLGLTAYPDLPPRQSKRPNVVITEEVSLTPDGHEDGRSDTGMEQVQVDLNQDWRDIDGRITGRSGRLLVDYTLNRKLRQALDGVRLYEPGTDATGTVAGQVVYVCKMAMAIRRIDEAENVHTNTYTVEVHRQI